MSLFLHWWAPGKIIISQVIKYSFFFFKEYSTQQYFGLMCMYNVYKRPMRHIKGHEGTRNNAK